MPDTVEHLKDCRYCYKKISSCATFCPNCGRSQSFTRNNLLFLGSTIGIVTFLISAAVYLWNEGNFFYEMAFGKDELVVHSLLEDDDAVVFNRGYRGLNLLRLKVNHSDFEICALYDIYTSLPTDGYVHFNIGTQRQHYLVPTGSKLFENYVENLENLAQYDAENIIYPVAAIAGDSDYEFRKRNYDSLANGPWPKEYQCNATLYYVPFGENKEVPHEFPCISMIYSKIPLSELRSILVSNKTPTMGSKQNATCEGR